jgi:hypothetical protein
VKLILCPSCHDVVKLLTKARTCDCGASWGKYTDNLNAVYGGDAIPLGFANGSLVKAIKDQPNEGNGKEFLAFVIPKNCDTMKSA